MAPMMKCVQSSRTGALSVTSLGWRAGWDPLVGRAMRCPHVNTLPAEHCARSRVTQATSDEPCTPAPSCELAAGHPWQPVRQSDALDRTKHHLNNQAHRRELCPSLFTGFAEAARCGSARLHSVHVCWVDTFAFTITLAGHRHNQAQPHPGQSQSI